MGLTAGILQPNLLGLDRALAEPGRPATQPAIAWVANGEDGCIFPCLVRFEESRRGGCGCLGLGLVVVDTQQQPEQCGREKPPSEWLRRSKRNPGHPPHGDRKKRAASKAKNPNPRNLTHSLLPNNAQAGKPPLPLPWSRCFLPAFLILAERWPAASASAATDSKARSRSSALHLVKRKKK